MYLRDYEAYECYIRYRRQAFLQMVVSTTANSRITAALIYEEKKENTSYIQISNGSELPYSRKIG